MEKVSVIIPVYNSEFFIRQCIQSVIDQTYQNYEILLIDDGSVDQSRRICEGFCRSDQRIRMLCQEHRGVSSARNHGLDRADGKYVLFLDSDDALHPLLLERLVQKAEMYQADLAFATCSRQETSQMNAILNQESDDVPPEGRWEVCDHADSEEWYHKKYARELTCIGGKLIRRKAIGALRFDESMHTGEDTVFMYFLSRGRLKMVYYQMDWYYYRMHPESVTHSNAACGAYFKKYDIIRRGECRRKRLDTAFIWEKRLFGEMQDKYLLLESTGNREEILKIKKLARKEMTHPLFRKFSLKTQIYYFCFFFFHRIYALLNRWLWISKHRKRRKSKYADVGILTFHCADDYGAMLQAYALKEYLCVSNIQTDIVRYEPCFMTGRYWWIPYMPVKEAAQTLRLGWRDWKAHCAMGKDFFVLKRYMKEFRKKYLVKAEHRKLLFCSQLKSLPYRCFVVGSDQIWNPEITHGLRRGYFGAFRNKQRGKVIAYAASLGGERLDSAYTRRFSELLSYVDAVSMREEEAVTYVRQYCKAPVTAVCDPVLLLKKDAWGKIERAPRRKGYILIYATQMNREMTDYVRKLSKEKGLPVVELRNGTSGTGESFPVDYEAGPAEFLGYIHQADYIVTNSFHAAAFSIIYQKKFIVFLHRTRGARLRNILLHYGLEDRLYQENRYADMDAEICWDAVMLKINEAIKHSGQFLKENLSAA